MKHSAPAQVPRLDSVGAAWDMAVAAGKTPVEDEVCGRLSKALAAALSDEGERHKRTHHMSATSTASPSDSAAHVVGVPRLVRRDLTTADMPPDQDNNEEVKTIIGRIQTHHICETMGTFCAKCRKQMRITMSYKCRWCGVWYCHQCAALHFGPDTSANE